MSGRDAEAFADLRALLESCPEWVWEVEEEPVFERVRALPGVLELIEKAKE